MSFFNAIKTIFKGKKQSQEESLGSLRQKAEQGDIEAQFLLTDEHQQVDNTNLESAFQSYQILADKGDVLAMLKLVELYETGQGVSQNIERANWWFRMAAQACRTATSDLMEGESILLPRYSSDQIREMLNNVRPSDVEGLYNLGTIFENRQVNDSFAFNLYEKTFTYYTKAAALNYAPALFKLGRIDRKIDTKTALNYLQRAAAQKYAPALHYLGEVYMNGLLEQPKGYRKAEQYFIQAAELGYLESLIALGDYYHNTRKAPEQAIKWYAKAALLEDRKAMVILSDYYKNHGKIPEATELLLKISNLGNSKAMFDLASIYYYKSLRFDVYKGRVLKCLEKLASTEDEEMMINVGKAYERGTDHFPQDTQLALDWYLKVAKKPSSTQGYKVFYRIARLYEEGRGNVEQNDQQAFEWYLQDTRELGLLDSMYKVANCYIKGKGVARDIDEARNWFQKIVREQRNYPAAKQNEKEAAIFKNARNMLLLIEMAPDDES